MAPSERLILFAKRPRPGRVKTRLVPPLTPEQARDLYAALLDDVARLVTLLSDGPARRAELCLDGPTDPAALPPHARRLERTVQGEGDLGQRMLRAFRRAHGDGVRRTVIVGADAPDLPAAIVHAAFRELARGADATLAPAGDGGYVLIGMRRPQPELFRGVEWGTASVADTTRARARQAGLALAELEVWHDVDDAAGLRRLRAALAADPAVAPATAAHLRALDSLYSAVL